MEPPLPRFYAIVDAEQLASRSLPAVTGALLDAGVRLIQYRDKKSNARQLYEASAAMAEQVRWAGGRLMVNDRADVAWASRADGVHLGQCDLPAAMARQILPAGKIIGLSTHSIAQVKEADGDPVDYIAFGPIFATGSKERADPVVGLASLKEARKATRKPLVAIGGITLERARSVMESGADSIAVIHALLAAPNVGEEARKFLQVLA